MTEETPPPTPLPPAAEPPYPVHHAPQRATDEGSESAASDPSGPAAIDTPERSTNGRAAAKNANAFPAGVGALGVTLIGGAVAATIGVLVAVPWLKRRKATPARSRRSRTRKTD